eukprot:c11629_g1_i1 orf=204-602(-)
MIYSASSTAASIRRRTKPRAIPMRTRPLMMGTTRKISDAMLQVEAAAPPRLPAPALTCAETTLAKCCSVLSENPSLLTRLSGFMPAKFFIVLPIFADAFLAGLQSPLPALVIAKPGIAPTVAPAAAITAISE